MMQMRTDVRFSIYTIVKRTAQQAERMLNSSDPLEVEVGECVYIAACALQDEMSKEGQ
jgi:hypothetical protein